MDRIEFVGPTNALEGANLPVGYGLVVEFATLAGGEGWGVWGIRVDGRLYRVAEGTDVVPLPDGSLKDQLERAAEQHITAVRQPADHDMGARDRPGGGPEGLVSLNSETT